MSIEAGRLPKDYESFDATLKRFWFDTCLHNKKSLELLFDVVGADRCLFATERPGSGAAIDASTGRPFDDLKPIIDSIETLTPKDKNSIYEGNARQLFNRLGL
jgi:4-oxalmesaconate hydratase